MTGRSALAAALLAACACTSCRQADKPVPRREAYARIHTYRHIYAPVGADTVPVRLAAAHEAGVEVSRADHGAWWVTISYPRYRANIYVTVLPVRADSLPARLAERAERLALDMGSTQPHIDEWSSGRYTGITATAPWVLTTPIKLLAHDGNYLVSATAYCQGYTDADQMSPVVEALGIDMTHLLTEYEN